MESKNSPGSILQLLEACQNELLALMNRTDGWSEIGEKDGVAGFQLSTPEGRQIIRAVGNLRFSCEEIAEFLCNPANKKSWDGMLHENRVINDFGNRLTISYERFSAPWPVSHRDFVFATNCFVKEDGLLFVAKSVDAGVPEVGGVVRGEVILSGFYLKRLDDTNTQMTYLVCVDPKGSLPGFIVKKLGKNQSKNVNKIRHVMEKGRASA